MISLVAAGDEGALRSLYEATGKRLFGLVARIVGHQAAEETVLDALTQVWRRARRYDATKGTVFPWLATIARNRAIDRLRSRAHRDAQRHTEFEGWEELSDRGPCPRQRSQERESATQVRTALRGLPGEQRQAIEMAFFRGLSHSQVAEHLGAPLGTVKSRIRAGIHAIRREMGAPAQSVV